MNANFSSNSSDCIAAKASVLDVGYNIVRAFQLLLGLITTLLLYRILSLCKRTTLQLHGNLKVLLINVLLLYAIYVWAFIIICIRNFVLIFTHATDCDCLNPVLLVYLLRMPFYMYIAASPMFHFAIMAERVWATICIQSYERQGRKYGVASVLFVWLLTLLFGFYVFLSSIEDSDTFGKPLVYFTLTSKYNAHVLINVHYFFLFLVICISLADYMLIRMNRRIKISSNLSKNYSLSRSYQANENILTMRIIFPLDFSYTFVFTIFNILSSFIRSKREEYGLLIYMVSYEAFTLLLFLHAILTLLVYEHFVKKQKKKNSESNKIGTNQLQTAELHFRNLKSQWQ